MQRIDAINVLKKACDEIYNYVSEHAKEELRDPGYVISLLARKAWNQAMVERRGPRNYSLKAGAKPLHVAVYIKLRGVVELSNVDENDERDIGYRVDTIGQAAEYVCEILRDEFKPLPSQLSEEAIKDRLGKQRGNVYRNKRANSTSVVIEFDHDDETWELLIKLTRE